MKKIFLIALALALANVLPAQHSIELNAYTDNYSSPGAGLAYTFDLTHRQQEKPSGLIDKRLSLGLRAAFYHRVNHHAGYLFSPFLRHERVGSGGVLWQVEVASGYLYKKNQNTTFELVDGEVTEVMNAGHHRFFPSAALSLGYDFGKKNEHLPVRIHVRAGIAWEMPNNISGLLHFPAEIGLAYRIR